MTEFPGWDGPMGEKWARLREATDRQLAEVGYAVLGVLDAQPGERVIDLGCGGGTTTLAIADAVGTGGRVTGVDISPDLVAHARARTAHLPQVEIVEADATGHRFEPQAHDALLSRHGCMFFADAAAAFANIRTGLKPGARLTLSAFAPLDENPWATVPLRATESVLGPAPTRPPGAPGPFAWANPGVFQTALDAAGFRDIHHQKRTVRFTIGTGDYPDPVARAVEMVLNIGVVARWVAEEGGDAADRVRPALTDALAPHVEDGWVRLPANIWLVTARA